ncbi:MAG: nucleotidyltransferase family protein [Chloroflexia bacterium]|nr:nucleotidyltransferase family protein [Chloroflexia bacterium]
MSLIAGNLGAVQRLLDTAGLSWGVCAGAAAYVYGVRRPIANVDILLAPGELRLVRELLKENRRTAQYDGRILLWRGIKIFDDLSLSMDGQRYPFLLDEPMQSRLRRLFLLGSKVLVLSPEDVLAHKALLSFVTSDCPEKYHGQDLANLIKFQSQKLDLDYVLKRVRLCQAEAPLRALLAEVGLPLPA